MSTTENPRGFASDNNAGVHPDILKAMASVNGGHVIAYGDDPYTARAEAALRKIFGKEIEIYFVFIGTAANVLGLSSVTQSYHAVICPDTAHIHVDECGAPEKFSGCKLLTCHTPDGKLTVEQIAAHMHGIGFEHHVQPRVVSITQSTELGTVYSLEEIRKIADLYPSAGHVAPHGRGPDQQCGSFPVLQLQGNDRGGRGGCTLLRGYQERDDVRRSGGFFQPELCRNFKYQESRACSWPPR
jgi:hypothetical protein